MLDTLTRRGVLRGLGALVIGVQLPATARGAQIVGDAPSLGAYVTIERTGAIHILLPNCEMGQGTFTALAQCVADEMDADFSQVTAACGPEAKPFRAQFGPSKMMITGGSGSIINWAEPMRQAGASVRLMLVKAAAQRWDVPMDECTTAESVVSHSSGKQATYAELVDEAARLKPPKKAPLKSTHTLIGEPVPRLDMREKVDGTAEFGADVRRPGQRYAAALACPVLGGSVAEVDDAAARAMSGVVDVLVFDTWVAVVAEKWWTAKTALKALSVTWDEGENAGLTSAEIDRRLSEALHEERPYTGRREGKALDHIEESDDVLEVVYAVPYLDHAPMEPMNCTVHLQADRIDVWTGTQAQTRCRRRIHQYTGLSEDQIHIHTTLLGGGFGRRGNIDIVEQAVKIAMRVEGPVQLLWSREETFRHGFYRPAAQARMRATVRDGAVEAVHIQVASDNILHRYLPKMMHNIGMVAAFPLEGFLDSSPYVFENIQADWAAVDLPVPIGFWRSVGHSYSAYFMECFLDDIAVKLGQDPVDLRRSLLGDHAPRFRRVLDTAVEAAGWGSPPEGRFQGVALHESFGSICAEVAEISMEDGKPRVHRVFAAVDCGKAFNPGLIRDQIMSGVIFGLSAAMGGKLTVAGGRIEQSNFHDYTLLRMSAAPEVEVHILESPDAAVGGIGEVGTPPIAPAVCNAIRAATGRAVRSLPIIEALA